MESAKQRAPGWATFTGLAIVHLGALCAFIPGTFHWSALIVLVVLYYTTGAWGICLGYHRLLTHRSLKLWKPLEYATAILGTLALQGGPIDWIATHRAHHAHTDKEGDPHDIHRGLLWTILLGVALVAIGGWPWLIWGLFVRIVITYHITWLVNSAAHHSGYQTFRTGDKSTNNWVVAFLAWGEGWHNNHHAFPFSARHGLRWFEIDATWWTIKILAWMKLARDIKLPTPAMLQRMKLPQPQPAQRVRVRV